MIYGDDRAIRRQQRRLTRAYQLTVMTARTLSRFSQAEHGIEGSCNRGVDVLISSVYRFAPARYGHTSLHRWLSARDDA